MLYLEKKDNIVADCLLYYYWFTDKKAAAYIASATHKELAYLEGCIIDLSMMWNHLDLSMVFHKQSLWTPVCKKQHWFKVPTAAHQSIFSNVILSNKSPRMFGVILMLFHTWLKLNVSLHTVDRYRYNAT